MALPFLSALVLPFRPLVLAFCILYSTQAFGAVPPGKPHQPNAHPRHPSFLTAVIVTLSRTASLAARGGHVAPFWPVRPKWKSTGDSWEILLSSYCFCPFPLLLVDFFLSFFFFLLRMLIRSWKWTSSLEPDQGHASVAPGWQSREQDAAAGVLVWVGQGHN